MTELGNRSDIVSDLNSRGLIAACTNSEKFQALLKSGQQTIYCGFDPTSDSLTVGNLLALVTLKRFAMAGHKPIILIGNMTAMIGDPTGRTEGRPVLSEKNIHINAQQIAAQAMNVMGIKMIAGKLPVVFNGEFYSNMNVLTFMREIGFRFSVNEMLKRETVSTRLASGGLTFAEMSYALFQAADFDRLFELHGCTIQIGGADQWGNICAGVDLIRSLRGAEAVGMTFPLVTKSDGTKFGKSSQGAVWLDGNKTTPWDFFQFWINQPDECMPKLMMHFSFMETEKIDALIALHKRSPAQRQPQFHLAKEMTQLIHGEEEAKKCLNVAKGLFFDDWSNLTEDDFEKAASVVGSIVIDETKAKVDGKFSVIAALVASGLATSNADAQRLIKSRGVSINGATITNNVIDQPTMFHDRFLVLRKGKKSTKVIRRSSDVSHSS